MRQVHETALETLKSNLKLCSAVPFRLGELFTALGVVLDLVNWQREEIERLNAELAKQTKEALHWRNNHNADESL